PNDVLDRIAPTALPRSWLIISDEPLHRETNYRTEFVIALNNQPQGGIINRPRSPDIRVGFGWGGWGFNNTPGRSGYYQRPHRWWGRRGRARAGRRARRECAMGAGPVAC